MGLNSKADASPKPFPAWMTAHKIYKPGAHCSTGRQLDCCCFSKLTLSQSFFCIFVYAHRLGFLSALGREVYICHGL